VTGWLPAGVWVAVVVVYAVLANAWNRRTAVGVFSLSVVAALGWAWLFHVPHRLRAAAVSLAVAAVLTWCLVALVAASLTWAGVLLVPYAVWLVVATALAVEYARTA
jgi:tryptophan-rich sensory protein